jgi:Kef-type K+ transport system membrane component KefB
MRKVALYSILLLAGLVGSQVLAAVHPPHAVERAINLATMFALSFIMVHVGYEFEIDAARPMRYAWDYFVAATAAVLPWILCALYFLLVMSPRQQWRSAETWEAALLEGLFAAPTSAGVLFSMLAAAGLAATWLFKKARLLAIFDDLQTILLLIPLKAIIIGPRWQLFTVALVVVVLLYVALRHANTMTLPNTWPWVMLYSAAIVAGSEAVHWLSVRIDPAVPIHLEVLLPAFALGCVMKPPPGQDPHVNDAVENTEEGPEMPREQFVSTIVSAVFMVLVGLSMPPILGASRHGMSWGWIAAHVGAVTILSNLGKMFPALCYRRDASLRQRLALAIGMFPRGEVGAGVLVIAVSYHMGGPALTVAVLSLAVNLLCTGLFIVAVKRLIRGELIGTSAAVTGAARIPA